MRRDASHRGATRWARFKYWVRIGWEALALAMVVLGSVALLVNSLVASARLKDARSEIEQLEVDVVSLALENETLHADLRGFEECLEARAEKDCSDCQTLAAHAMDSHFVQWEELDAIDEELFECQWSDYPVALDFLDGCEQ